VAILVEGIRVAAIVEVEVVAALGGGPEAEPPTARLALVPPSLWEALGAADVPESELFRAAHNALTLCGIQAK